MSTEPVPASTDDLLALTSAPPQVINRWSDLAGSALLALAGLAVTVLAVTAPEPTVVYDRIGPMGFPTVLGGLLLLLGTVQSLRTLRSIRASGPLGPSEGTDDDEPDEPASGLRAAGFIVGCLCYIAVLDVIGYLIATPLAMLAGFTAMRYRGWSARIFLALAFTVGGFLVFVKALGVPLPGGVLADLLLRLNLTDYR